MTTFGERLKILADKLNKEDQDVAYDLGLSKAQMSHYTTGKRKVPSELLQKIISTYGINPAFLFRDDVPLYLNGISKDIENNLFINESNSTYEVNDSFYSYYPVSIAAGQPMSVDYVTEDNAEKIKLPNSLMGKWAGSKDVFITKTNGDSMNKIMPNNSLIVVKQISVDQLKDNDIVIFSHNNEYSVKRFFDDQENERFIFRPDSTDSRFIDYVVPYSNSHDLHIHGKVVMYIVELN